MSNNFCTTYSSLDVALENATEYAQLHNQEVFISVSRYGRHDARRYEFTLKLRHQIVNISSNICYQCKPNGDNIQLNPLPYEVDETTKQ